MEARLALRIFGACGLVSVLVDFDHLIAWVLWYYWFPHVSEGRIWHTPVFILTGIAICYMVSRLTGLYPKLVLMGVAIITTLVSVYSPWVVWGIME